jgi:CheY-like chemotaxis protein
VTAGDARILVVDDDDDNRFALAQRLRREGYPGVTLAENGRQALEKLAAGAFDCVLLDIMMPELDGFAVLDRLHADPETRAIPVVVLTAHTLTSGQRESLQKRAVALLEKSSYSAGELRSLVEIALGGVG